MKSSIPSYRGVFFGALNANFSPLSFEGRNETLAGLSHTTFVSGAEHRGVRRPEELQHVKLPGQFWSRTFPWGMTGGVVITVYEDAMTSTIRGISLDDSKEQSMAVFDQGDLYGSQQIAMRSTLTGPETHTLWPNDHLTAVAEHFARTAETFFNNADIAAGQSLVTGNPTS